MDAIVIKEDLIYELIFSDVVEFTIEISQYVDESYKYDRYMCEIKKILKKSSIVVEKQKLDIVSVSEINWYLKINRLNNVDLQQDN